MEEEQPEKWQSVLLVLDRRLECPCGNLAVVVTGNISKESGNVMDEVEVWCQDCFRKYQESDDE